MSSSDAVPLSDISGAAGTEPLACVSCRSRKLKCDRTKPACTRCVKVKNECVYPESRRKPTFRRRNVKELEARLAQVEEYLKEVNKTGDDAPAEVGDLLLDENEISLGDFSFPTDSTSQSANTNISSDPHLSFDIPSFTAQDDNLFGTGHSGQLMGLGLSETLPPLEVMEELNNTFFLTHYHFLPIIHSGRYYQAFYGPPMRKPPMCLQYAIWAMAACDHPKYDQYCDVFYSRCRQYLQGDEMKGEGEHFITVQHAQAWAIIASYEAKNMLFTRASMSSARCTRLIEMLGLDRLDREGDDIPPTLGPVSNWTELEERRRVFWGAFAIDSHASIATGWASLINGEEVMTRLPASEDAFTTGQEEQTPFLDDVFKGAHFGSFAGAVLIAQVFKVIMTHVHGARPSDHPEDLMDGKFWKRHRDLDNKVSSIFMFLPEQLRLPQNVEDATAVHTNLNLHAAVICLHHAAVEMVDKHNLSHSIKQASQTRLRASAEEMVNIIRITSHSASVFRSHFCSLSLYCATTVYVYLAKDDPISGVSPVDVSNLEIIINTMEAVGRVHRATCAFLQQACLDIERNDLTSTFRIPSLSQYRDLFGGPSSTIPIIARSSISKHTEISPPLPGRLPLGSPKGIPRPHDLKMTKPTPPVTGLSFSEKVIRDLTKADCFHAILGAVTRNVAPPKPSESLSHKRKRMSPSPGPGVRNADPARVGSNSGTSSNLHRQCVTASANQFSSTQWGVGDLDINAQLNDGLFTLPDRTNSSASSPAPRGTTGTDALTGSSHTSPGLGLGNTPEENRVDLRQFQGRVMGSTWQTVEEGVFERIINLSGDGNDPWALLNGDLGWNASASMG